MSTTKRKKYKFSSDWFSEWTPIWEEVLAPFTGKNNVTYLEVGIYEGRSLIWMFDNILTGKNCCATAIDPLPDELKETLQYNLKHSGHQSKIDLIEGYSQESLKKLTDLKFDIIYLDGSHKAKAALADLVLSWDLLKTDGIMVIDDYLWENGKLPIDQCPKAAVDSFLTFYGEEIEVIYSDYQLIIRKSFDTTYEQGKSYLKKNMYFDWNWWKLFELKKSSVKKAGLKQYNNTSDTRLLREVVPLQPAEIGAITKFLRLKKMGQNKPDFCFLNQKEKEIVTKYFNFN